jgi:hypothetical protein
MIDIYVMIWNLKIINLKTILRPSTLGGMPLKPRGVDSLGGVVYHVRPKFATPILHVINNFKNYEIFLNIHNH